MRNIYSDGETEEAVTTEDFSTVRVEENRRVRRVPKHYRSREEKAANLLYFIVKDHPFTDGNKRIGSLLFLLYLKQEGVAHRLNPQALTALTLLIAESAASGKDLMVRLIVNLLAKPSG